ncbi:VP2 [Cat Tien Hospitalitermes polycipi-like virus]|nr:VP2 [Cat Tien Hospitalitermes polycipi-like virus]
MSQFIHNPPTGNNKPQDPQPQTFTGSASAEGQQLAPIRSIGAPAMTNKRAMSKWRMVMNYSVSRSDPIAAKYTFNPWCPRAMANGNPVTIFDLPHWQDFSLLSCEYYTATPVWRFQLVAPSTIQGRYYFSYYPARDNGIVGNVRRQPLIEWDLSVQDYIDITVPSFSQSGLRPTRWTEFAFTPVTGVPREPRLPLSYFDSGLITFSCSSPVQILSLFPDTYDIVVWQCFVDSSQYCVTTPWKANKIDWLSSNNSYASDYCLEMSSS